MSYFCNPINVNYRYQFNADPRQGGRLSIGREAADPSMICFKGKYYIFASMNLAVWVSEDLVHWESHRLPDSLPLYDYAPDARVMGEYVYLCASSREYNCSHFRTKDILNGPYEEIKGEFDFWDPNMFVDDDGRVYFFWGCTNTEPIWGVEKDPVTMKNIGEPVGLIYGDPGTKGYERSGDNNSREPATEEEIEAKYQAFMKANMAPFKDAMANMSDEEKAAMEAKQKVYEPMIKGMFSNRPFIEGAWLTKYDGKYYLQYANPGTEYNTYNDGVYVSDKPLGPYTLQTSNPYSYKPGGFIPGAGHGSTMEDLQDSWWHAASMQISQNFDFERRVGLWPAGFDTDGELFCNQRYGDWPLDPEKARKDPWCNPDWYLLSYQAKMTASSAEEGKGPDKAADETIKDWWRAASNKPGEWLKMDLGEVSDVRAIQINFADDSLDVKPAGPIGGSTTQARWIDDRDFKTQWKLEGSLDDKNYFVIEDKSDVTTDLPHDLVVREDGIQVRYLKLTILQVPYEQKPCISGLRVFGLGNGAVPKAPAFTATRTEDRNMLVDIASQEDAVGYNILWGESPEKLYHSWMVFDETQKDIGALVKGQNYYVRVDAFNKNGITEGETIQLLS